MRATASQLRYLLRAESWVRWMLVVLLAIVVTAVEAVSALLIYVLLTLVTDPAGDIALPVIGSASNLPFASTTDDIALLLAIAIGVFFTLRSLLLLGQIYVQDRLAQHAGARLAVRLLSAYLHLPYAFHVGRNSADAIRNTYQSVRAVTSDALIPAVRLLSNVAIALGLISVLVLTAPLPAVLALAVLGPLMALLIRVINPRLKRYGRRRQELSGRSLRILQQSLHGIREVILFDRRQHFEQAFRREQMATAKVSYRSRVAQEVPRILIETVLVLFTAGMFAMTMLYRSSPQEALALLGLFAYTALRLEPALHKIVSSLTSIRFATGAIEDIHDDLRLAESLQRPQPSRGQHVSADDDATPPTIHLEGVGFTYDGAERPALRNVELTIRPGESIGIVGPTGGGKSTLVDLIVGLLHPSVGRVLVDGQDIAADPGRWQRRIGVVPQTVFLVDDTLRRNIALGVRDRDIDDARVDEVVRLARLADVVRDLPGGLDTVVGERGVRLSGGQRQRVAIARALYVDPSVLVLDEGTSALDNRTERELIAALEGRRGRRTTIAVAHRLTTVRDCHRIVVIEGGRITDIGTFDQLVAHNADFRRSVLGTPDPASADRPPAAS